MPASLIMDLMHSVLRAMRSARLKTALSVLGVSFGVAAVMAVLSIGRGGEARRQDQRTHRHGTGEEQTATHAVVSASTGEFLEARGVHSGSLR